MSLRIPLLGVTAMSIAACTPHGPQPTMTWPDPVCGRPVLSDPAAASPGVMACVAHADCGADEFCGEGYCRAAFVERMTLCLVGADVVGTWDDDGSPPDLGAVASDGESGGEGFGTEVIASSHPRWHHCEGFDFGPNGLFFKVTDLGPEPGSADDQRALWASFYAPEEALAVYRFVDQGCVEVMNDEDQDIGRGRAAKLWVSAWYP